MTISELTRRSIVDALILRGNISGRLDTLAFLERIWPLCDMQSTDHRFKNAAGDIWQHTINNDDWDQAYLYFEYLGLRSASDEMFERFAEGVVHPLVRQGDEQTEIVQLLNGYLSRDERTLVEGESISGHPVFVVSHLRSGVRKPAKNLIFAANGPKPDIVFTDAVSNDIAIVRNAEFCLVYDRPIPSTGLLWKELVDWWASLQGVQPSGIELEREFYSRLQESLASSPPEQLLFDTYFRKIRSRLGEVLPALIPQVYLHYDPYSVRERGGAVLERQRMDFLLILPRGRRIVIEVDGKQHYSDEAGASPTLYAAMVKEDRKLRLAGYEVFRFGGAELQGDSGVQLVESFFLDLFAAHSIGTQASFAPLHLTAEREC